MQKAKIALSANAEYAVLYIKQKIEEKKNLAKNGGLG